MAFENQECERCTRICYCMLIGLNWYCDECFTMMKYESQQKKDIEIILSRFGQNIERNVNL